MMPTVTCLRLIDVSVIFRVTYLQFPIQALVFLPCRLARRQSSIVGLPNIRHRTLPKICYIVLPRELFLTVKMETRHPIERSFGSEFMAICNHCIVMAAWSRKNVACLSKCRYCTDCAQNLPGSTPNNVLRVLQISSISVHFQLSHSRMHEHHQTAP